jgi:heme/copper-type cytochrome/quinol oxidase subunit 2
MIAEPEYSTSLKPKPTDGLDLEPVQNSSILLVVVVIVIIIIAFFLTSFYVLCEFSESAKKEQGTQQPRHMS